MIREAPTLKVCAERCPGCPFGPDRCVPAARARELLDDCDRRDVHFLCHEWVADGPEPVTCAGYYATGRRPLVFRFAQFAGIALEFVGRPASWPRHELPSRSATPDRSTA